MRWSSPSSVTCVSERFSARSSVSPLRFFSPSSVTCHSGLIFLEAFKELLLLPCPLQHSPQPPERQAQHHDHRHQRPQAETKSSAFSGGGQCSFGSRGSGFLVFSDRRAERIRSSRMRIYQRVRGGQPCMRSGKTPNSVRVGCISTGSMNDLLSQPQASQRSRVGGAEGGGQTGL